MNPISGAAPVMDPNIMKDLMIKAVAAQTAVATKTAVANAAMKVMAPAGGLDVYA